MKLCNNLFLGRTNTGEKYYLTIELRDQVNGISARDHRELKNYQALSFTGWLTSKRGSIAYERGLISGGQNYEQLLEITEPAKGFTLEDIGRLYSLWCNFHLNDMQSHCAHQDKYTKWDQVEPCKVTGYRAGSAWLVLELPDSAIDEIKAITSKVLANA